MRIALISDVHGNEIALDAVLADIETRGVDQIACLGDVATLGPSPKAVLERVAERADIFIMGNHDSYLEHPELAREYTAVTAIHDAIDWCRGELEDEHFAIARSFESTSTLGVSAQHRMIFFHGSPRDNCELLLGGSPSDVLDDAFDGYPATIYAGGHTHLPLLRRHRGSTLINPGSVGLAFFEFAEGGPPRVLPQADYAIVSVSNEAVSVEHISIELDRAKLASAAMVPGFPFAAALASSYG